MSSPVPSESLFISDDEQPWNPYDDASQQQNDDSQQQNDDSQQQNDTSQQQTETNSLEFCQYVDWDSEKTYDADPPSYIHYSIEWKVTVNNRAIMPKDTEQDIVLTPADYWKHFLEPKLQAFVRKKNRPLRSEDTNVMVSVTARSERNLTKRFDETNIEWTIIEGQLAAWGELFRAGKRLLLNVSFNYVDTSQTTSTSLQRAERRVYSSTTQQMLEDRNVQLSAEQASAGQLSTWAYVYKMFRCPGPPCHMGPYCWCDPVGKKHYKLLTCHLKSLIRYMDQGTTLQSHNDVPPDIREQLYKEEEQSVERRKKPTPSSAANHPPININVHQIPPPGPVPAEGTASSMPSRPQPAARLDIPGFRDEAVEEYCSWQQSKVKKPTLKVEYRKACDVMIEAGMDLELIHRDPNPEFLTERGIKRGPALHIVHDIDEWIQHKRARTQD